VADIVDDRLRLCHRQNRLFYWLTGNQQFAGPNVLGLLSQPCTFVHKHEFINIFISILFSRPTIRDPTLGYCNCLFDVSLYVQADATHDFSAYLNITAAASDNTCDIMKLDKQLACSCPFSLQISNGCPLASTMAC
jgi:hypothetical protein